MLIRVSDSVNICDWRLRIGEALQAAFAERIERDDRNAALRAPLQLMQHARAVDADVLPEEENAIRIVESLRASLCRRARRSFREAPTDVLSWHMFELSGRLL